MEEKVIKIETVLDDMQTRFARLLSQHEASQSRLKRRITKLESKISTSADVTTAEPTETDPAMIPPPSTTEKK